MARDSQEGRAAARVEMRSLTPGALDRRGEELRNVKEPHPEVYRGDAEVSVFTDLIDKL